MVLVLEPTMILIYEVRIGRNAIGDVYAINHTDAMRKARALASDLGYLFTWLTAVAA